MVGLALDFRRDEFSHSLDPLSSRSSRLASSWKWAMATAAALNRAMRRSSLCRAPGLRGRRWVSAGTWRATATAMSWRERAPTGANTACMSPRP